MEARGGRPIVRSRRPGPPLGEFVERLWIFEGYAVPHAQERLLPMATAELVVDLHADRASLPILAGPRSSPTVLDTSGPLAVAGVHFRPGGVFPFFGVSAEALHNQAPTLDLLWGARAAELRARLLAAPTPGARLDVLERALLSAARGFGRHRAVAFALRRLAVAPAAHRIGDL